MESRCNKVLLFKAPKEGDEDPFVKELADIGYRVTCIPVLEFIFVNLPVYTEYLQQPDHFSAIVFTSQRSVEATSHALTRIQGSTNARPGCLDLTCYVVGPSTRKAAQDAGFNPVDSDSGNADKLADFIIQDMKVSEQPILYPCGNLKQDILPKRLTEKGYRLQECVVYETRQSSTIASSLEEYVKTQGQPHIVVYFSPSGVNYTYPLISTHLNSFNNTQVIAIGQSTERCLKDHQLAVAGVCSKPDPSSLRTVIQELKQSTGNS